MNVKINSQGLGFKEDPQKALGYSSQSLPDQILFIIESDLDLKFSSSMEKIQNIIKEGNFYKFYITEHVCVINIVEENSGYKTVLPFGQLSENTLPFLKNGEVKYFQVNYQKRMFAIEDGDHVKGLDNQMLYEKEALLIINTDPLDLNIDFTSTSKITEIKSDKGRYRLYIAPEDQVITIMNKESGLKNNISLNDLHVKDVKYYFIYVQDPAQKAEFEVENQVDANISIGSYLVETTPPGALITMFGNPSFNNEKNKTPYKFEGFKVGDQIITLELNDYETIVDTIMIGVKKVNKSSYKLIPKFSFLKFNINPAPPYAKIFIDDKEESSITNNSNFYIKKGDKALAIKANHFYSQNMIISTLPGQVFPINVTLKPIKGQLILTCDQNSTDAIAIISNPELGITDQKIGKIPITTPIDLQEGEYTLIISKKGFGTFEEKITIKENKLFSKSISLVNAKDIVLKSNVNGAEVTIDGKSTGKTSLKTNLGIGKHQIVAVKANYEVYQGEIEIKEDDIDSKEHLIELEPMEFWYDISSERMGLVGGDKPLLSINNIIIGTVPQRVLLKTGNNKINLYVRRDGNRFDANLMVPTKKRSITFPMYNSKNIGLGGIDLESFYLGTFTLYGFRVNGWDSYFVAKGNHILNGYGKMEFRVGLGLSRLVDVCAFGNYNFVNLKERVITGRDTTYNTLGKGNYNSYGIEIQSRPNGFNLYVKAGISNLDLGSYDQYNHKNKFFVSVGGTISTGDNILRLRKKPISHNFLYTRERVRPPGKN